MAAAAMCAGESCWKTKTGKSWQYKSKSGVAEGMKQLKLKAGTEGKAQVQAKAGGSLAATPSPPLMLPVTAQLIASDGMTTNCWEAQFTSATKNEPGKLTAKAP